MELDLDKGYIGRDPLENIVFNYGSLAIFKVQN